MDHGERGFVESVQDYAWAPPSPPVVYRLPFVGAFKPLLHSQNGRELLCREKDKKTMCHTSCSKGKLERADSFAELAIGYWAQLSLAPELGHRGAASHERWQAQP